MKILFVHQNYPAQFKNLAPALVSLGHEVKAITTARQPAVHRQGVDVYTYAVERGTSPNVHPWVADFETKVIRGEAAFRVGLKLRREGFFPDVIIAHPGWGESLFLKEIWPESKLALYCEFFYRNVGADIGFDPEFSKSDEESGCRLRLKNINTLAHLDIADAAISPTRWQASTYPDELRDRITVIHDGINTDELKRNYRVTMSFSSERGEQVKISRESNVITFVNRNLEPYRGYHSFVRSLPRIFSFSPDVRVIIIGGDKVSYGSRPNSALFGDKSWKEIFFDEIRPRLTSEQLSRVHFLGNLPYDKYKAVLNLSTVHVYLTYPFVLSWSLLEAMSLSCAVVASNTAPLNEIIEDGENGLLVDFFDSMHIADSVIRLLQSPDLRKTLGAKARQTIVQHYDLKRVCLPKQVAWIEAMIKSKLIDIPHV